MPIVVGITLRTAGKIYYFDPATDQYYRGERVLVETARGLEVGTVRLPPHEVTDEQIVAPLKKIMRRASDTDLRRDALNREREARALVIARRLVGKLGLSMRLIDAQYTFDGTHILIHFLAEGRVDFRELVRELARELRSRIELRQVGVRDEAKLIGGFGICGRDFCCASFLGAFAPVAINMAKEQGLTLNPQKISGACGRLMCCLAFEHEHYKSVHASLPKLNSRVYTAQGQGKVTRVNIMTRQIEVTIPDTPGPLWLSPEELITDPEEIVACCAAAEARECTGCRRQSEAKSLPTGARTPGRSPMEGGRGRGGPAARPAAPTTTSSQTADVPAGGERPRGRRRRGGKRPVGSPTEAVAPVAPPQAATTANPQATRPRRPRRRKPRSGGTQPGQAPRMMGAEKPVITSVQTPHGGE